MAASSRVRTDTSWKREKKKIKNHRSDEKTLNSFSFIKQVGEKKEWKRKDAINKKCKIGERERGEWERTMSEKGQVKEGKQKGGKKNKRVRERWIV